MKIRLLLKGTDYVRGIIPDEILVPDGNWDKWIPPEEVQRNSAFDTENCVAYGTLNALETIMHYKYGFRPNYSERFTGIMAGSDGHGNDPAVIAQAIRKYGVIPEEMLPFDDSVKTVEQYFDKNAITQEMLDKGQEWLREFTFMYEWIVTSQTTGNEDHMKYYLKRSPLGISVYAWSLPNEKGQYYRKVDYDTHWTMCKASEWKVDDSYIPSNKELVPDFGFHWVMRYYVGQTQQQRSTWIKYLSNLLNTLLASLEIYMTNQTQIGKMADAIKEHEGYFPGSRSFRNKNPGNLKYTSYTAELGATGKDQDNFCRFASIEQGTKALIQLIRDAKNGLLKAYKPEMTITQFFEVFAPTSDRNQPIAYAQDVARKVGVSPDYLIKDLS